MRWSASCLCWVSVLLFLGIYLAVFSWIGWAILICFLLLAFLLSSQVQSTRQLNYIVRASVWDERLRSFLVLEGLCAPQFIGGAICVGIIALPDR